LTCLDQTLSQIRNACQLTFTLHHYLSTRHRRFDIVAMANYHYDESGVMASYFVVSILFIILIPLTYSFLSSFKGSSELRIPESHHLRRMLIIFPGTLLRTGTSQVSGCQCRPCVDQRARIHKREGGSLLRPKISKLYVACWRFIGWDRIHLTSNLGLSLSPSVGHSSLS